MIVGRWGMGVSVTRICVTIEGGSCRTSAAPIDSDSYIGFVSDGAALLGDSVD